MGVPIRLDRGVLVQVLPLLEVANTDVHVWEDSAFIRGRKLNAKSYSSKYRNF